MSPDPAKKATPEPSPSRAIGPAAKFIAASTSSACRRLIVGLGVLSIALPASAVLDSVGPVDPAHGFPTWYMDRTGVALELCINTDAALLAAGGCAILPAAPPAGVLTVPEAFPANWATEHFYTLASVVLNTAGLDKKTGVPISGAGRLVVNMGLEASFASGSPTSGDQITFNRWRVRQDNLACTGNYTYYTPNSSPQTFSGVAGARLFQTSDVGIGSFEGPLQGTTGPFLQWSATPGGAVKAPFIGPDGKKYIADYAALGTPVTGSDIANPLRGSTRAWIPAEIKAMPFANYVLVEGPGVATGNCAATEAVYTTTGFQLFGRYFEGVIPSVSTVDRATFRAVDSNADGTPDSFQVGVWASAQQKPGAATPALGMSLFSGDPAAPSLTTPELAMSRVQLGTPATGRQPRFAFFQGTTAAMQAGSTNPAVLARPAASQARVRVVSDTPATVINVPLVDELKITQAIWDSATKALAVTAESGAFLAAATPAGQSASNALCSEPCLTLDAQGLPRVDAANAPIDFKLRSIPGEKFAVMTGVIPNVRIPPGFVTVTSSAGGRDTQPVMYAGSATGSAIIQPDVASVSMNTPATIAVLANDVGVSNPPGLQICTAATGGTCGIPSVATACAAGVASPSCTGSGARLAITADNRVTYSPPLNLGGLTEAFWYQVNTPYGLARAQVTVNVGNLSGLPDARDDLGLTAVAGTASIFNVLANDFAPAGINTASLRITQTPCNTTTAVCTAAAAGFNTAGGLVFNAPGPGAWTLAYTFDDRNGTVADQGVVTVAVAGAEVLTVQRARWTAPKRAGQLGTVDANGTSSIRAGQSIELRTANALTGPQGCSNPAAGTRLAATTLGANGAWAFGAIALPARPATVYVYSPALGGCSQVTVQ